MTPLKIPNMQWSAELLLASALSLPAAESTAEIVPPQIERRNALTPHYDWSPTEYTFMIPPHTHTEYHFPESSGRSISADSGSNGTTALPPIAEFSTNWTPRLFPPSYKAVYPPVMQPWHLGWLDDEFVGRVTGN